MKKWHIIALAGVVFLAGSFGTAYLFRKEIILHVVATQGKSASPVLPNQEITWQQGPAESSVAASERAPNIVLILADDLGFNDISHYGGGIIPTPNIDSIARNGVNFSKAYSGTAACAPSRAMIMTGRHAVRTGFEFTPTPNGMTRIVDLFYNDGTRLHEMITHPEVARNAPSFAEQGLPSSEITLAEALKPKGYHTVHIGKWHLGSTTEFRPMAQGFDESVMLESGLYLPEDHPDVVNAKLPFDPFDQFLWARMQYATSYNNSAWFEPKGYLTDFFTDEAIKAIDANRNRPFFLYLAHWGVHTPLQASREDYDALSHIEDERMRVYAAMIRSLDRSVGRVIQKLKDEGLYENTLIIFSSDNGAPGYIGLPDVNKPYRGWKLSYFEGGIRVPFFMQWPAHISAGNERISPAAHLDMFRTITAAADAPIPTDRVIDGINLLPYAMDENAKPAPRALFWNDGHYQAVQADGWKLQVSERPAKTWLYDLNTDPTEQKNLAEDFPAKVEELKSLLAAHNAEGNGPLFPAVAEMPVLIDKTLDQPATEEDEYIYWPG